MATSSPFPPSNSEAGRRNMAASTPSPPALSFLNHSPDTLSQSQPSNPNSSATRQKRKRTSKEDEEILKAEFRRNPKPDKATRMDIVSKVAMGEKEVQIWFQNRRQNERRRTRPSQGSDSTAQPSSDAPGTPPSMIPNSQESELGEAPTAPSSQTMSMEKPKTSELSEQLLKASTEAAASGSSGTHTSPLSSVTNARTEGIPLTQLSSSQTASTIQDSFQRSTQHSGYLANRRSASFKTLDEDRSFPFSSSAPALQPREKNGLHRSNSSIRLSLTADGQAKVVNEDESSPSPPRARPQPNEGQARSGGLRRSFSAVDADQSPSFTAGVARTLKFPKASTGRSRDSRAWEFWCDSDARNSLADKAEQEGSGSAADAIGLIRANSKSSRRPLANKTNTPTGSPMSRRLKGAGKTKPAMLRSLTSHGRLQSSSVKAKDDRQLGERHRKGSESSDVEIPNNESDKENWEPGDKTANDDRRKRQRREHLDSTVTKDAISVEDDEEIASFMGNGSGRASIANGEELGCVEGLLKLSQGGWR